MITENITFDRSSENINIMNIAKSLMNWFKEKTQRKRTKKKPSK